MKKPRHYAFGECDFAVSPDPKEVYFTWEEAFEYRRQKGLEVSPISAMAESMD